MLSRRGIDRTLAAWLESHGGEPYAVALMDVDEFKTLNDILGHQRGDEVLCELARRVEATFPDGAIVGRNGGDEFLAFLGGESASLMSTCLAELTGTPSIVESDGATIEVCLSAGYVLVPDDVATLREAYSKADAALFSVKITGKGHCRRYIPTMETQVRLQSGFTPRDFIEHVPGAVCCHRVGTGELLLANEGIVRLFECEGLGDFMAYTGSTFSGIVHPDDRERVRDELIAKRDTAAEDRREYDVFEFRIVTKTGRVRRVTDIGHLVHVTGVGEVFYELIIDLDEVCGCPGEGESAGA
jgi:diguanylate cyclase (GGDEF)-like protein